ncbi:MAG: hypothetical protein ACC618_00495 [Patescibacteria group bacterium]
MKIVSLEGIGGSGKSTLSKLAKKKLTKKGLKILLRRPITRYRLEEALSSFPGKRERVWVSKLPVVPPREEALCYLALLIKDNECLLKPNYDLVIFDRYIDTISSGVAARNNLSGRQLNFKRYYDWFKQTCYKKIKMPDKTIVLNLEMNLAEKRTILREMEGYTKRDRLLFSKISEFYEFLESQEPKRVRFIDSQRGIGEVLNDVLREIESVI